MSESSAWSSLRKSLKMRYPKAHIQRFEDTVAQGIPDSNVALGDGRDIWLEGKHIHARDMVKRDSSIVRVWVKGEARSSAQCLWIENRILAGGVAFLWLRWPGGWKLFDRHFRSLYEGISLLEFKMFENYTSASAVVDAIDRLSATWADVSIEERISLL